MNTRREAIDKGIPLAPPKNDKLRRALWHDYARQGLYMLTLVLKDRRRLLGRLITLPYPQIEISELGRTILVDEFKKITAFYPNVKVWKRCIMPDHIHFIVEVTDPFPAGKHLGSIVAGFKTGCNRAYRRIHGLSEGSLFEPHYNDRIIRPGMNYERWKRYMDDNPRRLAIKHLHPEYFTTRYSHTICGNSCNVFGNLFLLEIPDKMAVIVHRSDTDADYAHTFDEWMACGERGGVLIGAFIAPREKQVMQQAAARGYSIIHLCHNGFGPYHKPTGDAFDACAAGRLLQISLNDYSAQRPPLSRAECLLLNTLSTQIAAL